MLGKVLSPSVIGVQSLSDLKYESQNHHVQPRRSYSEWYVYSTVQS